MRIHACDHTRRKQWLCSIDVPAISRDTHPMDLRDHVGGDDEEASGRADSNGGGKILRDGGSDLRRVLR